MNWVETLVRYSIANDLDKRTLVDEHVEELVRWIKGNDNALSLEFDDVAQRLELPRESVKKHVMKYFDLVLFSDLGNANSVLGLTERTNPSLVKDRYRSLVSIYHPDRGYFKNLGIDLTKRTEELNRSYAALSNPVSITGSIHRKGSSQEGVNTKGSSNHRAKFHQQSEIKINKSTHSSKTTEKTSDRESKRIYRMDVLRSKMLKISIALAASIVLVVGLIAISALPSSKTNSNEVAADFITKSDKGIENPIEFGGKIGDKDIDLYLTSKLRLDDSSALEVRNERRNENEFVKPIIFIGKNFSPEIGNNHTDELFLVDESFEYPHELEINSEEITSRDDDGGFTIKSKMKKSIE